MFSGFNVVLTKDFFNNKAKEYDEYVNIGIKHLNIQTENRKKNLNQYIIEFRNLRGEFFCGNCKRNSATHFPWL